MKKVSLLLSIMLVLFVSGCSRVSGRYTIPISDFSVDKYYEFETENSDMILSIEFIDKFVSKIKIEKINIKMPDDKDIKTESNISYNLSVNDNNLCSEFQSVMYEESSDFLITKSFCIVTFPVNEISVNDLVNNPISIYLSLVYIDSNNIELSEKHLIALIDGNVEHYRS